ncbi:MAG: hypothetical protein LBV32_04435 [Tannerellaceae bacterium]|jgi:hypothetical protein|nr:hypothetical protein [Tannerellaceae bacterium]
MKLKSYIFCLLSFVLPGCVDDYAPVPENDDMTEVLTRAGLKEGQVFYYYGIEDKKIFLDQETDKVFVKFAPNVTKEQFRSVLTGYTSLKPMDANAEDYFVEGYPSNAVVLVGEAISPEILNSLKSKVEVVSATYLLKYNEVGLSAYSDEFTVKLKDGTSFTQLQELAEKYGCTTGKMMSLLKINTCSMFPKRPMLMPCRPPICFMKPNCLNLPSQT